MSSKPYTIIFKEGLLLGIGNPLLDISATVDNEFLMKYDFKPDDAILANDKHKNIYKELIDNYNVNYIAGGSVQNTLRVAQWILNKPNCTVYFGCVGKDNYANILEQNAKTDGVNVRYQISDTIETGTCAVLITGQHRSLCANLGAANQFTIDHIRKSENRVYIENAEYYYISGFFLTVSPQTIMEVAKFACEYNRPFIMNLSAAFISELYFDDLMNAIPYVDILFGNETEALTFANKLDLNTNDLKKIGVKMCCLNKINKNRPRIVIITQGSNPVLLFENYGKKITEHPIKLLPLNKVVDTNGAGDAFVGGFLSQYIQNKSYDICIKCGNWAARHIIQNSGCTFDSELRFNENTNDDNDDERNELNNIENSINNA